MTFRSTLARAAQEKLPERLDLMWRVYLWGGARLSIAAVRGNMNIMSPEQSILLYRMDSIDPGVMMPELGRSTIHKEGVKLIQDFIQSLD